ncbi:MAG: efflux transporter outer membrane subunit [Steroidobacteraceae bacterium]
MNRSLVGVLSGIGLALAGCSLAPTYQQPQAPVPTVWPAGPAYPTPDTSAPRADEVKWQEFFTDVRLKKLIEMALANNRDLRLAALSVERARALYGVQRAELYPAVGAVGTGGRQQRSTDVLQPPGQPRTVGQYSADLGIAAWEIDFFGRIRSLSDQALEEYLATDEARRAAQIGLITEVARAFLALAADRENLQFSRATLESQQADHALVRRRFEVGMASELDLKRSQVPLETARRDVARYTQLVAQDKNALDLLVGTSIAEDLLPADLAGVSPPQPVNGGLDSDVLLLRPDVMAAEHRLRGAYANIGAARAALFPRISLTTTVGTASNQLSGLFDSGTGTWAFTPQFVMPIFDARLWSALRVSETDREIIQTQYEKTIQTAFREVSDALAVQGTIDEELAAQQSLVEALADSYRLATRRFDKGIDGYLSVLDAQRAHFAAQQALTSLREAKMANQVRLYAVLGGGGV